MIQPEHQWSWERLGSRNALIVCVLLVLLLGGFWRYPVSRRIQKFLPRVPERSPLAIGSAGGRQLSDEELEMLITTPSKLRGFQNKTGPLNPIKWLPDLDWWRMIRTSHWFEGVKEGSVDWQTQPPDIPHRCKVYVNHDYRFFWIRQHKTGSTTLTGALGQFCEQFEKGDEDPTFCTSLPWRKPKPGKGNPHTWWMNYFVFTAVRNPYSRYVSAYQFLHEANYLNQTLGESCQNPFLFSLNNSEWRHGSPFYLRHIMEQTSCLFTEEGGMAVDFVAQTENLEEDFAIIAQEINKRKRADIPPMNGTLGHSGRVNHNKPENSTYAPLFRQYPECIKLIEKISANEFEDLMYIEKPKSQGV